ncbi:FG-GAP repeat domain-containing protein [Pelobium manganitolerans]|uniref:FG-GAP repeat domain-containing protein n=1 Tax=Pelobium manganitolerans TaxID=1842495 RepID=UPI003FA3B143
MKTKFYLSLILSVAILFASCEKEQLPGVSPHSNSKELVEFAFLQSNNPGLDRDYICVVDGQNLTMQVPKGVDLGSLVPTFKLSEQATLRIGDEEIRSDQTAINVSKTNNITIVAGNGSMVRYNCSVLLVGLVQDFAANSKTSYYNYIQNNLYIDLASVITKTSLNVAYHEDAYTARAYADFDKDGDMDIIAGASNTYGKAPVELEYYKNDVFSFAKDQSVFSGAVPTMLNPRKAIVGDFDKNGWLDVFFVGSGFDAGSYTGETAKILMNNNGKFTSKDISMAKGYIASAAAGDIDNDGDLDLFITDNKSISRFLINDGKGNFTEDLSIYPSDLWGKAYYASELYDVNNDGYLDIVTGGHEHNSAQTIILLGNASGKFMTSKMLAIPAVFGFGVVVDIDFIDYDKDGKTDVLVTRTGDGKGEQGYYKGYYLQLMQNQGAKFADVTKTAFGSDGASASAKWINLVRVQDLDKDGSPDISTDDQFYGLSWTNKNGTFVRNGSK